MCGVEKQPLLSVIVPVYNTAKWLRRCLDSICGQTYPHLEIICVNDGSTDDSLDILNEYATKDSRIVVINQKNGGLSAARNVALRLAKGQYVTGVDSDDWVENDTYMQLMPYLQKNVDMVCYGIKGVSDADEPIENEYFLLPAEGEQIVDEKLLLRTNVFMCNKLFRTEIIRSHGILFPEGKWYEDLVFFYLAGVLSRTICYVPGVKYCYMIHGNSFTNGECAKNRAFDFCGVLEILYNELRERHLMERWESLYRQIFLLYYEQTVPLLPSSRQRAAKKMYKRMVRRCSLHKRYAGYYPFDELNRYTWLRSLFFWRNAKLRVYKFLRWPLLRIEDTPRGQKKRWF